MLCRKVRVPTPKVSSPSAMVMALLRAFGPSVTPPGRRMLAEGSVDEEGDI